MYNGADRGWSIDSYSGPVSVGDRRRFRILSEFSIASSGRADQLFCMNRNGAVAWVIVMMVKLGQLLMLMVQ